MEEDKFEKSREYAVTGLSINQDTDSSLVAVTDTDRQDRISTFLQKLAKEEKNHDLDLRIYNEEAFEKIIPFKKKIKSEIPLIKLTFYKTTTKNMGLDGKIPTLNLNIQLDCQLINKVHKKSKQGKKNKKKTFLDKSRVCSFAIGKMERKQLRDYLFGSFFHTNAIES